MSLKILSTLRSKRLSFQDSIYHQPPKAQPHADSSLGGHPKSEPYYCFSTLWRQGLGITCIWQGEEKQGLLSQPTIDQPASHSLRPHQGSQMPQTVVFSMQADIWAPKIREKKCNESSLIAFFFGSISPSDLASSLYFLAVTSTRGPLEGGWGGGPATEDRRGYVACFTETALLQPPLSCARPPPPPRAQDTKRSTWGTLTPRGTASMAPLLPRSTGGGQVKRPCPPAQPLLSGSQTVSAQNFPKLILHLSAEAVHRKISVRQENIWKLRPIGGEDFFFLIKSLLAPSICSPGLLLQENPGRRAGHLQVHEQDSMDQVCSPSVTQWKADTAETKMLFTPAFWNSTFWMTRSWLGGPSAWNQEAEFWQYLSVWFFQQRLDILVFSLEKLPWYKNLAKLYKHTHNGLATSPCSQRWTDSPWTAMITLFYFGLKNDNTYLWEKSIIRTAMIKLLPTLLYSSVPRSQFYIGINRNLERVTSRVLKIFEDGLKKMHLKIEFVMWSIPNLGS